VTDASVYDPVSDKWQRLAPLTVPLGSVSVAVLDGKIHVVGGHDRQSVGAHRVYDPSTNSWSELAPLPNPRDHMGLVVIGGKIFAVGGRLNTFEYNTNELDVYDAATNSWKSLKPMPTARSGMAVAVLDGKIFAFGGERLGGTEGVTGRPQHGVLRLHQVGQPTGRIWGLLGHQLAPR